MLWSAVSPRRIRVVAVRILLTDGAVELTNGVFHPALLGHLLADCLLLGLRTTGVRGATAALYLGLPHTIIVVGAYIPFGHVPSSPTIMAPRIRSHKQLRFHAG